MNERDWLKAALDHVINLERGLAGCSPITDEDQQSELLRAKDALKKALDLNGRSPTRLIFSKR